MHADHLNQPQLDGFAVTTAPTTDFVTAVFDDVFANVTSLFDAHVTGLEALVAAATSALQTEAGPGDTASNFYVNGSHVSAFTHVLNESVVFIPVNRRGNLTIEACSGEDLAERNREISQVVRQTANLDPTFRSIAAGLQTSHRISQVAPSPQPYCVRIHTRRRCAGDCVCIATMLFAHSLTHIATSPKATTH
jgi:hypothetical protein